MPAASGEFVQGYNVQAAVDHDSHLVLGARSLVDGNAAIW